mmetsp:Transcript_24547/g.60884  ORF Transcript_24547/g.60884 Transcript_24547/m.60884 type:complete len:299 (-) Transcript_24547:262-1158(-)
MLHRSTESMSLSSMSKSVGTPMSLRAGSTDTFCMIPKRSICGIDTGYSGSVSSTASSPQRRKWSRLISQPSNLKSTGGGSASVSCSSCSRSSHGCCSALAAESRRRGSKHSSPMSRSRDASDASERSPSGALTAGRPSAATFLRNATARGSWIASKSRSANGPTKPRICRSIFMWSSPLKSGARRRISPSTQPADHRSIWLEYRRLPHSSSGQRYQRVTTYDVPTKLRSSGPSATGQLREMPKSAMRSSQSLLISRLDGFRSRWTTPAAWSACSPHSICHTKNCACSSVSGWSLRSTE